MRRVNAWWPSRPLPGNFGDILTPVLLKELFGCGTRYANKPFEEPTLIAVGSIISHANENCTVWGSGLMSSGGNLHPDANYLSVRGPRTYERLKEKNINCPAIFGDPALLLPMVFNEDIAKIHEYGIFAHYVDTDQVRKWYGTKDPRVLIIDPLNADPMVVVRQVMSCKRIISSSLHGVIVAQAYGIPAVWVRHSDKLKGDDTKFHDYYESVGLKAECLEFQNHIPIDDFDKFNYQVNIDIQILPIYKALERHLHP